MSEPTILRRLKPLTPEDREAILRMLALGMPLGVHMGMKLLDAETYWRECVRKLSQVCTFCGEVMHKNDCPVVLAEEAEVG